MAKYERKIRGNFDEILRVIDEAVMTKSSSASLEDSSYYYGKDFRSALRVYERYSFLGGNRVSMSVLLIGSDDEYRLTIITAGGSQAMFVKINTVGEKTFLNSVIEAVDKFK